MSIGLPGHLGPQIVNRAVARAGHVIAYVCLIAAFSIVASVQADQPTVILWPALLALVPIAIMLWRLDRNQTLFYATAYVVIGALAAYWFALTVMTDYQPLLGTNSFVLTLPKIAIMLVGAPGRGTKVAVSASVVGYAAAELAIIAAAVQTGATIAVDGASLVTLGIVASVIIILSTRAQRSRTMARPNIHRAARDEQVAAVRYIIEARAAAVMHDTVLNDLAAISSAVPGAINDNLRTEIERDLRVLVGEEWLADISTTVDAPAHDRWENSELFRAVNEAKRMGLTVAVSGDLAAIGRLGPASSTALGLAAKQCLINVLKHAGTGAAEVVVYGSESAVSVMVIDTGRGFSEAETGADRLGLRHSVRRRIDAVDGQVQVWSTAGKGTSIMISVPAESSSSADVAGAV